MYRNKEVMNIFIIQEMMMTMNIIGDMIKAKLMHTEQDLILFIYSVNAVKIYL